MLFYLHNYIFKGGDKSPFIALEQEDYEHFQKLMEHKCYSRRDEHTLLYKALIAKPELVAFFYKHNFKLDYVVEKLINSRKNNHVIQYIIKHCFYKATNDSLQTACMAGNLELAKWLVEHEDCDPKSICTAYVSGERQFETLKWLYSLGCKFYSNTVENAAYFDHQDMVIWCIKNGCSYTDKLFEYVVKNLSLDLLKKLYELDSYRVLASIPFMLKCLDQSWFFPWSHAVKQGLNFIIQTQIEFLIYLFTITPSKQDFWNLEFNSLLLKDIDLRKEEWKPLFVLDLSVHPVLKARVDWIKTLNIKEHSE